MWLMLSAIICIIFGYAFGSLMAALLPGLFALIPVLIICPWFGWTLGTWAWDKDHGYR